jgi:hypothetical protein
MPYINARGEVLNDGSKLHNGEGFGVGAGLLGPAGRHRLDPGFWQPYLDSKGRTCLELRTGRWEVTNSGDLVPETEVRLVREMRARGIDNPVWNAATLRKDQWVTMQQRVVRATRQRLNAWADLSAAAPASVGGSAWGRMTYEYQAMNDPGEAVKSMDPVAPGRRDRPLFNLVSIPLPVTHSDFYFSDRELEVAAQGGFMLDTTMAEAAGRRIGELVEQTLIGTATGVTFGPSSAADSRYASTTSTEYGYTNFPWRVTKTDLTAPTGTNPEAVMTDVLEMVETMQTNGFFGPYRLYTSTGYSRYLSDDYFRTGSTSAVRSLRERLMEIEGIASIKRLDYLTSGYQMILVQMDAEHMQALNGMDVTVMRWTGTGGLEHFFKVMAIMVPILKAPYNGVAPIIHGTTS